MSKSTERSRRSLSVGILILVAYSMLTYDITGNRILGMIMEVISGVAVIAIPILLLPVCSAEKNRNLKLAYLVSRLVEGTLMLVTGILLLIPPLTHFRDFSYQYVHICFFILGALFLYILLYRTELIPRFISVWGIIASILLIFVPLLGIAGVSGTLPQLLIIPIILNELFLAFWLIFRGFNTRGEMTKED